MAGMRIDGATAEMEGVLETARRICIAARTAPKGRGIDTLSSLIITGEEKESLAAEMERQGREKEVAFFVRDAGNVRQAAAIVVLGTRVQTLELPNCGFCGHGDCAGNRKAGGICAFNTGDLGIAIGSAVSIAADQRVDTRVMFSAGKAAVSLGLLGAEVRVAYGIPLSVSGKNPFFDRK
jgi:uncharacterized ferredoxin-like protein